MNRAARREDGQILVIFAVALIALLGIAGLALDGGSTFAQRRDQQSAADLAALAAANDYLISGSSAQAIARARTIAASNGYTHGSGGTAVDVAIATTNGIEVTVGVGALHRNAILGVVGMPTWAVSTRASAQAGFPDTAHGAAPFIFPVSMFGNDGTPMYQTPTDFGETNGDIPTSNLDFAWTNFGTGNLNSTEVDQIIKGDITIDKTVEFGEYIGQANNGNHTTLYQDVNTYMSGYEFPAAIVDGNGNFVGWTTFHVISADPGSSKHIRGYFLSSFESSRLSITTCAANDCPRYMGSYVLKLTN